VGGLLDSVCRRSADGFRRGFWALGNRSWLPVEGWVGRT